MRQIAEKLVQLEKQIAEEKGPFLLFGLFLREDAPAVWDLVVSAHWLGGSRLESLRWLSQKLKEALEPRELVKLSRIVIIAPDNPGLKALQESVPAQHDVVHTRDCDVFEATTSQAYIITSSRPEESPQTGSAQGSR